MADYKTIHGTTVKNYTADPDNPIEGQVWYDGTAATLQYQIPNVTSTGAWRAGNSLNTARQKLEGAGTQTAGLAFGGDTGSVVAINESYNGTTWTEVADLNTGRKDFAGAGTQTSAIAMAGQAAPGATNNAETWNGTAWTEVANLNTTRNLL